MGSQINFSSEGFLPTTHMVHVILIEKAPFNEYNYQRFVDAHLNVANKEMQKWHSGFNIEAKILHYKLVKWKANTTVVYAPNASCSTQNRWVTGGRIKARPHRPGTSIGKSRAMTVDPVNRYMIYCWC